MEQNADSTKVVALCAKILEKMTRAQAGQAGVAAAERDGHAVSGPCLATLAAVAREKRVIAKYWSLICATDQRATRRKDTVAMQKP